MQRFLYLPVTSRKPFSTPINTFYPTSKSLSKSVLRQIKEGIKSQKNIEGYYYHTDQAEEEEEAAAELEHSRILQSYLSPDTLPDMPDGFQSETEVSSQSFTATMRPPPPPPPLPKSPASPSAASFADDNWGHGAPQLSLFPPPLSPPPPLRTPTSEISTERKAIRNSRDSVTPLPSNLVRDPTMSSTTTPSSTQGAKRNPFLKAASRKSLVSNSTSGAEGAEGYRSLNGSSSFSFVSPVGVSSSITLNISSPASSTPGTPVESPGTSTKKLPDDVWDDFVKDFKLNDERIAGPLSLASLVSGEEVKPVSIDINAEQAAELPGEEPPAGNRVSRRLTIAFDFDSEGNSLTAGGALTVSARTLSSNTTTALVGSISPSTKELAVVSVKRATPNSKMRVSTIKAGSPASSSKGNQSTVSVQRIAQAGSVSINDTSTDDTSTSAAARVSVKPVAAQPVSMSTRVSVKPVAAQIQSESIPSMKTKKLPSVPINSGREQMVCISSNLFNAMRSSGDNNLKISTPPVPAVPRADAVHKIKELDNVVDMHNDAFELYNQLYSTTSSYSSYQHALPLPVSESIYVSDYTDREDEEYSSYETISTATTVLSSNSWTTATVGAKIKPQITRETSSKSRKSIRSSHDSRIELDVDHRDQSVPAINSEPFSHEHSTKRGIFQKPMVRSSDLKLTVLIDQKLTAGRQAAAYWATSNYFPRTEGNTNEDLNLTASTPTKESALVSYSIYDTGDYDSTVPNYTNEASPANPPLTNSPLSRAGKRQVLYYQCLISAKP
ncbi:unnamed protein product [Sphagnum jensenii]|uniref:Uncharacterized protein n=1 Tax=Sphagnum jensenii TaxID=128206 RepID=A0ABP0VBQ6_9BRYO